MTPHPIPSTSSGFQSVTFPHRGEGIVVFFDLMLNVKSFVKMTEVL